MDLTTASLKKFVGGQLEVQNKRDDYLYRGEIRSATVDLLPLIEGESQRYKSLKVEFTWLAKMGEDGRWHVDKPRPYIMSLQVCSVDEDALNRIDVRCFYNGEIAIFFPKGGSTVPREKIIGL